MIQQEEVPTSPQDRTSPFLQPLVGSGQLLVNFCGRTNTEPSTEPAATAAAAIHVGLSVHRVKFRLIAAARNER